MHDSRLNLLPLIAFGVIAVVVLAACNGAIDDPDPSASIVSVGAFTPISACVEIGEDIDGDGTIDPTTYSSTEQVVTLDSRLKGRATSNMNDVVFTKLTIDYLMTVGSGPPQRNEGIAVTVPAGGTTDVPIDTVLAADIPGFFTLASRGNIRVTFSGHDIAGRPVTAVGFTPIEPATVCSAQ